MTLQDIRYRNMESDEDNREAVLLFDQATEMLHRVIRPLFE